jgi:integrase
MTTKRGFGSIRRLPSGNYQARYTGPDLATHSAPNTFRGKALAESWLSAERKLIEGGTWTAPAVRAAAVATAPQTFAEYAAAWLATRELKPRTVVEYRRLLAGPLASLGGRPVPSFTPAAVRAWYATLDPGKPTRRAHAYALLRAVLHTAVDDELLASNPCRIRGAGSTSRAREIHPPTVEELSTILEATPDRYRAMVAIASWGGLRFGELVALRRSDVDLTKGVVSVRRAAVRVAGETVIGDPKSRAGIRTVALPPHLVPMLREHLRTNISGGRDGLLFPTPGGKVMTGGDQLGHWWYPAREAAGRKDLRFHDLRHFGATMAARTGATLAELMRRIGHSTPHAALKYQHAADDRDAEIARRLSELAQ